MTTVTVRAPGLVNVQLGAGHVEEDGYRDVADVLHAVSIYDEVTVGHSPHFSLDIELSPELPAGAVPRLESDLVVRAARLLADAAGRQTRVAVRIRKRLPIGGGLAGGAADAAATLVACNELWNAGLTDADLTRLGAELGPHVPFALRGGTTAAARSGPVSLDGIGHVHWVLAFAATGPSTPQAHRRYGRLLQRAFARRVPTHPLPRDARAATEGVAAALASNDPKALGAALRNDLQEAALRLRPDLLATLDTGLEQGALGAFVTGNGPSCAFVVESYGHAVELIEALDDVPGCASARYAVGPVAGAEVV